MIGALGQILSGATNTPYLSDLMRWLMRVQQGAVQRWLPIAIQGIACSDQNQKQGKCTQTAIAVCEFCRSPTCLDHALVGSNADVVCMRCITRSVASNGAAPKSAPKPPDPVPVQDKKDHFKVLSLRTNATLEQVKSRYKKLALKHHPDRPGGTEEQFRRITASYEWLLKNHFKV